MMTILDENHIIFKDESKSLEYLLEKRILKFPIQCTHCHCYEFQRSITNNRLVKCSNGNCNASISLLHNTFFHQTSLKIHFILLISYYWLAGKSSFEIAQLTRQTISKINPWICKLKYIIAYDLDQIYLSPEPLGGRNIPIHIYVFTCPHVNNQYVIVGIERISNSNEKKAFAFFTPFHNPSNLLDLLLYQVLPGSIITTNCWESFTFEELRHDHIEWNPIRQAYEFHDIPSNEALQHCRALTIYPFQPPFVLSRAPSPIEQNIYSAPQLIVPQAPVGLAHHPFRSSMVSTFPSPPRPQAPLPAYPIPSQEPTSTMYHRPPGTCTVNSSTYAAVLSQVWRIKYQRDANEQLDDLAALEGKNSEGDGVMEEEEEGWFDPGQQQKRKREKQAKEQQRSKMLLALLWERLLVAISRVPSYDLSLWHNATVSLTEHIEPPAAVPVPAPSSTCHSQDQWYAGWS
jgi:hypothetical protein